MAGTSGLSRGQGRFAEPMPLWLGANFSEFVGKANADKCFAAFGRFIAAYALAEAGFHVAARHFSGLPGSIGLPTSLPLGTPRADVCNARAAGETWSEALLADFGFSPEERLCGLIVSFDEGVDVGDEFLRLVKDAPLSDFADRIENQISIWLSQEAWVGV